MNHGFVVVVLAALAFAVSAQPCTANGVGVTLTVIDGSLESYFYASDNSVVFALSSNNTLYRSVDEGKTWASQNSLLALAETPYGDSGLLGVRAIQPLSDPQNWVFLGQGPWIWVTSDSGASYQQIPARKYLRVQPHPTNGQAFLAVWQVYGSAQADCPDCPVDPTGGYTVLDISLDLGVTIQCAGQDVLDFDWLGDTRIVVLVDDHAGSPVGHMLLRTDNLTTRVTTTEPYCPSDFAGVLLGTDIIGFSVVGAGSATTLWAAQQPCVKEKKGVCQSYYECVVLLYSPDLGTTFQQPTFPPDALTLQKNGYSIHSISATGVLISTVNHVDLLPYGSLFASPNINDTDSYFSLSLVDEAGDSFTPVGGMPGVILTNQFANPKTADLTSVRTGSSGAVWTGLTTTANEPLQLHGYLTGISIYSLPSAVGQVWGTGNTGAALDTTTVGNTYFSNDGGYSFAQVSSISQIYETADSGALLAMSPWAFGPGAPVFTGDLTYSLTMGANWTTCKFTHTSAGQDVADMRVINVVTNHPWNTIRSFLLIGEPALPTSGPMTESYLVHLDFSNMQPRQCSAADYEQWAPPPAGCLSGQQVTLARRKADAACYNEGAPIPANVIGGPCACTVEDYYCGPCYQVRRATPYPPNDEPKCVPEKVTPCPGKSCNKKYDGYRLVEGDKCQGGFQPGLWTGHCGSKPFGGSVCGEKKKKSDSNADLIIALIVVAVAVFLLLVVVIYCVVSQRRKSKGAAGPAPTKEDVIRDTSAPVGSLPNASPAGYTRHDDEF